jgi:hypothetical protein
MKGTLLLVVIECNGGKSYPYHTCSRAQSLHDLNPRTCPDLSHTPDDKALRVSPWVE